MVSVKELELLLLDEEINEIYDSLDMDRVNRLEKEHKEYLEYTKKSYHPISYELEIEERTAPQYGYTEKQLHNDLNMWYLLCLAMMGISLCIGGMFALLLLSALFGSH